MNMTTQLTLTESETEVVRAFSQIKGKTLEETLHEVIEGFIEQHKAVNRSASLQ